MKNPQGILNVGSMHGVNGTGPGSGRGREETGHRVTN